VYEKHFGFARLPFDLTPNPAWLVRTPAHGEALSMLEYALSGGKGLTVLTGPAGTGKTTVLRAALQEFERSGGFVAWVSNPALSRSEFMECLASAFRLSEEARRSKAALVSELDTLLRGRRDAGVRVALVVDEAQCLPLELLEEIRLLGNIETDEEKLLCIVLAGQPELRAKLNDGALRQLKQRVALRCELQPFSLPQTASYIAARIKFAGGSRPPFTREALMLIHRHAQGIPRTINVICDNALISAFAADHTMVGEDMIREVVRDLDLNGSSRPAVESHGAAAATPPATPGASDSPSPDGPAQPGSDQKGHKAREDAPLFSMFTPRRRLWLFR
jgi:type II secretory pathway predicted ATPase ExeA